MNRCAWANSHALLAEYHDAEWGVPLHDDERQFEFLCMEVMQCGLSWLTVLKKREAFRCAFDDFDAAKVACYTEEDIGSIMQVTHMIRSPRKIRAIINNARAFLRIRQEFGTFSTYLWRFTDNRVMHYPDHTGEVVVSRNELSDIISKDLRARGFTFLGSITVYAHLQAAGLINDHAHDCFRYHELRVGETEA